MSWVTNTISNDPEVLGQYLESLVDRHYGGDWGAAAEDFTETPRSPYDITN